MPISPPIPDPADDSLAGSSFAAGSLTAVARLAFRLGCTAFGGPAAHIGMLHDEVVRRRHWFTNAHFLDMLGATNLIPGPNSTEMVMHIGMERAGWHGLVAAGLLFIMPASAITLALAWLYVRYGATPAAEWLLYGVKPVVIAIIAQAVWALGHAAITSRALAVVALAALALSLAGVNELVVLLGAGAIVALAETARRRSAVPPATSLAIWPLAHLDTFTPVLLAAAQPYDPLQLFLRFLKIGATLFGSGYVLLAFVQQDFVDRLGWLTERQLLDAVAVGQFTPGPVSSTATFVGYLVGGWPGAVLATIGIFLPAFLLVGFTHALIPRIRTTPIAAGFLDGVNAAAIALMVAVAWAIGRAAVIDELTAALATIAVVLLLRFRVNSAVLIVLGAAAGLLARGLSGWLG
ncbi:MAG: chromate efflux transporter [Thermomicrobiales bacterium]|nr:chromate efflux transporter [Thermomicrobiales bacterium]